MWINSKREEILSYVQERLKKTSLIMAIAMVAMLAFGGTYAYFTATAKDQTATLKTGHVKLSTTATFIQQEDGDGLIPGDSILVGGVSITPDVTSEEGVYVAIRLTATVTGAEDEAQAKLLPTFSTITGAKWKAVGAAGADGAQVYVLVDSTTDTKAKAITGATNLLDGIEFQAKDHNNGNTTTEGYTSDYKAMDTTVVVKIEARAIQVAHNTDINTDEAVAGLFTNVIA